MINETNLPIVVLGHVDHGKSTLIGRMLYDSGQVKPDRLEEIKSVLKKLNKEKFEYAFILDTFQEEREDSMTIDTVQIPFKSNKYLYNFIDCPGHKEFIKNMITGTSYGEMVMFVVSIKPGEGVQSQSREHAWIAKKMGIDRMIVAVNKMDTVDYDREKFYIIVSEVKKILTSIGYKTENMQFIPVSALEGDNVSKKSVNMEWYKGLTLIEALDKDAIVTSPPTDKPLRIPVQDIYEIGSNNRIIVGRIESGKLRKRDEVIIKPSGEKGVIESIKMWNVEKMEAVAGKNIGIKISGISKVKRGDVFGSVTNEPNVANEFIAEVFMLEENGKITVGNNYNIRCGTALIRCKAEKILNKIDPRSGLVIGENVENLTTDEAGTVNFVATKPFVIEKQLDIPQLGRILVKDARVTIAFGVVIITN